jgi:hypothetical protein
MNFKNNVKLAVVASLIFTFHTAFAQEPVESEEQIPEEQAPEEQIPEASVPAAVPESTKTPEPTVPSNIITWDLGPTIIGVAIGIVGDMIDQDDFDISGFGLALQYERQLLEWVSVAGRFAYLGSDAKIGFEDNLHETNTLKMGLSTFAFESHGRVYPFKGAFFLNAMLGYESMSIDFSGKIVSGGVGDPVSLDASRGYLKLGGKLGWRIDFGKPGGLVLEIVPLGWSQVLAKFGDTFDKQLTKNKKVDDIDDIDDVLSVIEDYIFIGGPRATLALGWRF